MGAAVNLFGQTSMANCTFAGVVGYPAIHLMPGAHLDLDRAILAFGTDGSVPVRCEDGTATVAVTCTDIFGNDGGDWVDCISGMESASGNLSADPLFCNLAGGDLTLRVASPCAPEHSGDCGQIGADGVGCGTTGLAPSSWSQIKGLYR